MNPYEIRKQEWIGLTIEVVDSANKSLIGLKGKIIDETKNTFIIKYNGKLKTILKDQVTLKIKINDKQIQIKGKLLAKRPEERIKSETRS